jgi:ligand-binding SRPBCC domain-containing protein
MPCISDRFQVNAPLEAVSLFHRDTRALRKLTPPPVVVRFQRIEPLANGSVSEFTLWFGPFPVPWRAVHTKFDPESGFCDTQVSGPMRTWVHTHHWERITSDTTLMEEKIEYEYPQGWRGFLARLLFAPLLLRFMLTYRKWIIRREARNIAQSTRT